MDSIVLPNNIKSKIEMKMPPIDVGYNRNVSEAKKCKQLMKLIKNYPNWDCARQGPELGVITCRRKLEDIQKYLQETKLHNVKKQNLLKDQWESIKVMENDLRKSFQHFNRFVIENKEKRDRAKKEIKKQLNAHSTLEQENQKMQKEKDRLLNAKNKLTIHLKNYYMYGEFLKKVVEKANVADIGLLLKRYDSITSARETITVNQAQLMETLEHVISDSTNLTQDTMPIIIGLNVEIAKLRQEYEKIKAEGRSLERLIDLLKNVTLCKDRDLYSIQASCWDMYVNLSKKRGKPIVLDKSDTEGQLTFINESIAELRMIVERVRLLESKETRSDNVTLSNKSQHVYDEKLLKI